MILNLTQHTATDEQRKAGVIDLPDRERQMLQVLLTFEELPTSEGLFLRAAGIIDLIEGTDWHPDQPDGESPHFPNAMIGGAPFFMPVLAEALKENGIQPLYAFSQRIVEEQEDGTGGVRKVAVFRHVGFVPG